MRVWPEHHGPNATFCLNASHSRCPRVPHPIHPSTLPQPCFRDTQSDSASTRIARTCHAERAEAAMPAGRIAGRFHRQCSGFEGSVRTSMRSVITAHGQAPRAHRMNGGGPNGLTNRRPRGRPAGPCGPPTRAAKNLWGTNGKGHWSYRMQGPSPPRSFQVVKPGPPFSRATEL
jgi:hypothetical protein